MKKQQLIALLFIAAMFIAVIVITTRHQVNANPAGFVSGAQPAITSYGKISGQKVILTKLGIYCGSCREAIAGAMSRANGVYGFKIDVQKDEMLVGYDSKLTDIEAIKQVIVDAGYKVGGVRRI